MLEKTLESPLDCEEIKSVNPNGNQPWIFIGRTNAEAEAPILWPPDVKNWLFGKDSDAGKYLGQEEKWATEDEMLDGITDSMDMSLSKLQEIVKDRKACSPWGRKESDTTEWLSTAQHYKVLESKTYHVYLNLSSIVQCMCAFSIAGSCRERIAKWKVGRGGLAFEECLLESAL